MQSRIFRNTIIHNHCDNPACIAACQAGAIAKDPDTGLVSIDAELCDGCGSCALACPCGAPRLDGEKGVCVKCDGCADRVAAGLAPVCVEACPLRALEFGDVEELRAKYGETAAIAPLPDASATSPSLVVKPPRCLEGAEPPEGSTANIREIV